MSRAGRSLAVLGILIAIAGIGLAVAIQDSFLGLAVLIIGAFLIILPLTRPSLDED
jgi:sulfite exporter TauE/SafE